MIILLTIFAYFAVLFTISHITGRKADNETFFRAGHKSPWYMVAFGMIGASVSGVTFVSVPGMILMSDMTYMQTCLGFILGYIIVAFVLLPVYYRLNLTTIYSYLKKRLGNRSYKTGAAFFMLSDLTGVAVKFYVVCIIIQRFVLDVYGIPFWITVFAMMLLIWLYTKEGGIRTLVWTDSLQTLCMIGALVCIIMEVANRLGLDMTNAVDTIINDTHCKIFVFDDWVSRQNFWKQFISGAFIVVVMTGLNQNIMQKNLTCKSLKEAQKDMCTYGMAFVPVNLLLLCLGILLVVLSQREGVALPDNPDELLTMFAATGRLGNTALMLFVLGLVAASLSTVDSSLTALTTSYCVDIKEQPHNERLRHITHFFIALLFAIFIILFKAINSTSAIDAVYILCSYTYGPLLGLFAYGLLTKRSTDDRYVPYIAITSPILCLAIDYMSKTWFGYVFGYEMLLLNGSLTFTGLALSGIRHKKNCHA
ncbi:MAG: sodium:solute symporter [Prevotella sp.]